MKRIGLLALAALLLVSCSTAAMRQGSAIHQTQNEAGEEMKKCIADVYSNPDYAAIVGHFPSADSNFTPTMEQLNDETFPTKAESKLIAQAYDETSLCKRQAIEKIGLVTPTVAGALEEAAVSSSVRTAKLVKRKITWGENCREAQQEQLSLKKKLLAADQEINNSLQASHEAEIAQRQAAANAFMEYSLQQQAIDAANRPVYTNCNRSGTYCVSH